MKTIITSFLLLLTLNLSLVADELTDLQKQYNTAIKRVTDPINKSYTRELQKLLEKVSKDGDIDKVGAITDELKKFIDPTNVKIPTGLKKDINSLFVGKVWITPLGTEFHFKEKGQGFRKFGNDQTMLSWKLRDDLLVEVEAKANEDKGLRIWFFKFESKTVGKYGQTPVNLDMNLVLKQF